MTRLVADLPTPVAMRIWSAVDGLAAEYARAQPGLRMGAARADALADLDRRQRHDQHHHRARRPDRRRPRPHPRSTPATAAHDPAGPRRRPTDGGPRRAPDASRPTMRVPAGAGVYHDLGGCEELDDGVLHDHGSDDLVVRLGAHRGSAARLAAARRRRRPARTTPTSPSAWPAATRSPARSAGRTRRPTGPAPAPPEPSAPATAPAGSPAARTAARRCQLDHVVRHPDGPTTVTNLQALCATHHGFKHHAGWQVEMDPVGVCTWTAPDGRTHTTRPHGPPRPPSRLTWPRPRPVG